MTIGVRAFSSLISGVLSFLLRDDEKQKSRTLVSENVASDNYIKWDVIGASVT